MLRGFTREVLAIFSWAAAAFAAVYFYPLVVPYVKPYFSKDIVQQGVSAAAVFFGTLVLVSLITIKLSDVILDSKVGALDRSLGFVFGVARGVLLCAIAFLFFSWLSPEKNQPEWVRNARTRPFLQATGDQILALLPEDLEGILNKLKKPKGAGEEPAASPDPDSEPKNAIDPKSPAQKAGAGKKT
jgi:membrane protein required for colicin V production